MSFGGSLLYDIVPRLVDRTRDLAVVRRTPYPLRHGDLHAYTYHSWSDASPKEGVLPVRYEVVQLVPAPVSQTGRPCLGTFTDNRTMLPADVICPLDEK